jgi:hypothetical protein
MSLKYTPSKSRTSPKSSKGSHWTARAGGNRLDRLHTLLVGDRNHVDSLPADDPRRRPTMPAVRLPELEEASAP